MARRAGGRAGCCGASGGNPLFVAELLRAYQRADALAEDGPDTIEARFELSLRGTGLDEVIRGHLVQLERPPATCLPPSRYGEPASVPTT